MMLTDAEVVKILATRGMGLSIFSFGRWWIDSAKPWGNPLTDLNAVHEVEKRLTPEQRRAYSRALRRSLGIDMYEWPNDDIGFAFRNADARTCAYALAEALRGGR